MEIIHDSQEVQGDTIPAVILGDTGRFLPDEEGGYFLTVHGVDEDLLQEDGGATEGGFGTVIFLASKSKLNGTFALEKALDTPAERRQMLREATCFADLRHLPPLHNVVRVADVMVSPTPMLLMVCEESTLADMLEGGGDTKFADLARVLDGVLDEALGGVEALFGAVVFHRDVKPDTILIGKDGRGVLVDF
ncbi:unnamed protein product [Ascophyllum nodosum]